jgi:hypothetical protein
MVPIKVVILPAEVDLVGEVASLLSSTYGPDGGIELSPLAKNSFQQSVLMNLSIRVWSPLLVEAASFSRARFIWVGSMHQLEPRFSPHLELRLIAPQAIPPGPL